MKVKLLITVFMEFFFLLFVVQNEAKNLKSGKFKMILIINTKVSQFEMLKDRNNIEIMMLGDSITDEGSGVNFGKRCSSK